MNWYYAEGGQRFGPVPEEEFQRLVSQGRIVATTLVWCEGMPDWRTFAQVAQAAALAQPGGAPAGAVCSQCGRYFAADDMIQYRGAWVCAICKPLFFQRIREGQMPLGLLGGIRYAGFWIRFGATIIDGIILWIAQGIVAVAMGAVAAPQTLSGLLAFQVASIVVQTAIAVFYATFFVGKFAATPGKMACSIKIIVSDGGRVGYGRAFGRYWGKVLSSLGILLGASLGLVVYYATPSWSDGAILIGLVGALLLSFGYYMAAFDKQKRALHDHICNTRVVWK